MSIQAPIAYWMMTWRLIWVGLLIKIELRLSDLKCSLCSGAKTGDRIVSLKQEREIQATEYLAAIL